MNADMNDETTLLKQLQLAMQDYVLSNPSDVQTQINPPDQNTVDERLDVYREAYFLRLVDILIDDYAQLVKLLGDEAFDVIARDYLDQFPSDSFTVRDVGRYFSRYLKQQAEASAEIPGYYAELAEFEWALNDALYAEVKPVLSMSALSAIPPEAWGELCLILQPSCHCLTLQYPILDVIDALENDADIPEISAAEEPIYVLIWCQQREAYYMSLGLDAMVLYRGIMEQKPFAELCEMMLDYLPENEVVQWVASTLQSWVKEGLFVSQ